MIVVDYLTLNTVYAFFLLRRTPSFRRRNQRNISAGVSVYRDVLIIFVEPGRSQKILYAHKITLNFREFKVC